MVIDLQQQAHKLDPSDKAFLKYMINVISLGSFVEPSLTEQKTLFEIKRKLDDEQWTGDSYDRERFRSKLA